MDGWMDGWTTFRWSFLFPFNQFHSALLVYFQLFMVSLWTSSSACFFAKSRPPFFSMCNLYVLQYAEIIGFFSFSLSLSFATRFLRIPSEPTCPDLVFHLHVQPGGVVGDHQHCRVPNSGTCSLLSGEPPWPTRNVAHLCWNLPRMQFRVLLSTLE